MLSSKTLKKWSKSPRKQLSTFISNILSQYLYVVLGLIYGQKSFSTSILLYTYYWFIIAPTNAKLSHQIILKP
jgi:hypothetical protein